MRKGWKYHAKIIIEANLRMCGEVGSTSSTVCVGKCVQRHPLQRLRCNRDVNLRHRPQQLPIQTHISNMPSPKPGTTFRPRRVRDPQQLERKRHLDRVLQKSRRQRQAAYIEALQEENRNMRQEIDRLRSAGDSGTASLQNTPIPAGILQAQKPLQCCREPGEQQVRFFEKAVFDTLIQSRLHPLPLLARNPSLEDLLFLRQPQNPASAILYPVLKRPSLQDIVLRTAYYLMCWRILRVSLLRREPSS